MTPPVHSLRSSFWALLALALLTLPAAANTSDVASGDNDGGWGLPGSASGQEATANTSVEFHGAAYHAHLSAKVGTLAVSLQHLDETPMQATDDLSMAEIVADTPLRYLHTADGKLRVCGEGSVRLGGGLQVDLHTPLDSVHAVTMLIVDEGAGSAAALLDDVQAQGAITQAIPVEGLTHLDVDLLAKLAVEHAPALADADPETPLPAISLLHASLAADGSIHASLIRVSADGSVEFVLR